jgi:hypothetical protein
MQHASEAFRPGVVRGISYGLFGKPDPFMPEARTLGARVVRAYFFWGQIEPRPGEYTWDAVDTLLDQLDGDEEVWITLCSSSPWATRTSTDFLPPSPAQDLAAYADFVRRTVAHCGGRVRYWQCDNEPSNTELLWAGTADEYVAQLGAFYAAVKSADAPALVVLGGCGYDVLSSPPDSEQRQFFDRLSSAGRDAFDLFDVHLYGDPYRIPEYVATARQFMAAHGYQKPVVAGEYGGPSLFEFSEVEVALQTAVAEAFSSAPPAQSTEALTAQAWDTPERVAMKALLCAHGQSAGALADVHARLPTGARGETPPYCLPPTGDVQRVGAGEWHPTHALLEPRARGAWRGRPVRPDALADRQAAATGLSRFGARVPPPGGQHL